MESLHLWRSGRSMENGHVCAGNGVQAALDIYEVVHARLCGNREDLCSEYEDRRDWSTTHCWFYLCCLPYHFHRGVGNINFLRPVSTLMVGTNEPTFYA